MSRHPDVRQSLRDLSNVCGRLFVAKRDHSNDEHSIRAELDPALGSLHKAVDAVIGRRALAS